MGAVGGWFIMSNGGTPDGNGDKWVEIVFGLVVVLVLLLVIFGLIIGAINLINL